MKSIVETNYSYAQPFLIVRHGFEFKTGLFCLQRVRSTFPKSITAIFLSPKSDYSGIQQVFQTLKQAASDVTIVVAGSSTVDAGQFPSDKLFFIQPQGETESADLLKAIQRAIELSPSSDSFLVFTSSDTSTLSQKDLRRLVGKHADYIFRCELSCTMLSRRYAKHLALIGDTPSVSNAIKNGFSAPMSISQIVMSPEDAIRQYATILKFGTVGASGIAVNLIVLTLLRIAVGALIANAIAQELSIINNFVWNDRFTFRSSRQSEGFFSLTRFYRFVKYNLVSLLSFSVNETVFYLAYSQYHVFYITSALLAIAVAFVVNYVGSSRWAWARTASLSVKD